MLVAIYALSSPNLDQLGKKCKIRDGDWRGKGKKKVKNNGGFTCVKPPTLV